MEGEIILSKRVVVVGAGEISKAWFPLLLEEKVEVSAVVDLNRSAAKGRIKEYNLAAKAYTDLSEALRKHEPDFVLDLTIPQAHCKVVCSALKHGCHVLGEKPMAASMMEARRMVRTAEGMGCLYMVDQSRRWDSGNESVRRTVASGRIGKVTAINCDFYAGAHFGGFREEMESPLILDMAIHHFDLARFMTGADPVAVYAKEFNPAASWYSGDAAASCIFEMTDGVIFTYCGSWCTEGCRTSWHGDWRIAGEKGTLLYTGENGISGEVVAGRTGFTRKVNELKIVDAEVKAAGMHGALKEMLAFLRSGKRPQTEARDNIKSLAMVFAAIESSRKGRRVLVRY